MIAIAGSKGGCGKTKTTLGLANAFAKTGTPTLAVDADRQMPDLHILADVDRTPTIAALDGSEDAGSVAQEVPEFQGVSVLPGVKPAESADIQRTLNHMDTGSSQVVIDCPSGTGPDLTDPLSAADKVVLVTTSQGESVKDARTTADIADRLDVPVAGVIVTKTDSAPDGIESELGAPVLATVPESESPLSDEEALAAYDRAVANMTATTEGTVVSGDGFRMSTGTDSLDRALGGGLAPGSMTAILAEPATHSERILHRLTATRGTLYLTTDRSEWLVRETLSTDDAQGGSPAIRAVDSEDPLESIEEIVGDIPESSNVVIDTANALESCGRDDYLSFLERLKKQLSVSDSVAVFHCLRTGEDPPLRAYTQRVADNVIDVSTAIEREAVGQRVSILKCRGDADGTMTFTLNSASDLAQGETASTD